LVSSFTGKLTDTVPSMSVVRVFGTNGGLN
jgi:hypothetical protein